MFKITFLTTLVTSSLYVLGAPTGVAPVEHGVNATTFDKRVTHVGRATWFHAGLGNCGYWDNDDTPIVAVSTAMYKQGGNCNQWVELINTANGNKVYAKMRDSCPPCGYDDVDLSPNAFQALAPLSQGVSTVSWHFMNRNWSP
ncbi:hypothetical protein RSOLAG1IB_00308 [Rhizoctonia solani AG-1 IB]|uniref:RlpA-like protein double-psi beta-barrel domain-containing protein n=2 Tax=Rhizoctonia solani TaxID=456999 RepID=M5BKP9_THACB|nr:unnamed protein product [Rhizoctonia solani]CCO27953.1 hypothetical protein BN14_01944 [Rhizoctonia solani AG-1 IB]CEL51773.1 hypothetical protein RSOLAG1IB_00308 [Rhizoctonia solani AG-1 IB]